MTNGGSPGRGHIGQRKRAKKKAAAKTTKPKRSGLDRNLVSKGVRER
jgi:hypothetical protein